MDFGSPKGAPDHGRLHRAISRSGLTHLLIVTGALDGVVIAFQ